MSPADLWVDAGIEPSACQVCGRKNCEDSEHASEGIDVHDVSPPEVEKDGEAGKKSQATILVQLARAMGAELFHDDDTAYLHVPVGGHCETHRLRSRSGRAWLASLFFERLNRAPGSQAITDAMNTLEALAVRGPEHRVYVRLAAVEDRIFLDLVDAMWRVVEVTATSWRIVANAPVRFRRPKGLLPLPLPQSGRTIGGLRPFVNVASDDDFVLLVSVLVGWLRGRGPYPLLVENGEQGSAKSTLTRVLKALIDPNVAPLRSAPREPRDLMIAAAHGHVLGFDNLSDVPAWLSDALCRLSTGGGFSTRTLYSDDEEQLFDAVRPVVLNGIPDFASRPDLVSRSVFVSLPPISDDHRRDETTFWADFDRERPVLLGALLDLVSAALRHERAVSLDRLPRMADFARWVVAAEPACPWPAGTFLRVYAGNREQAIEATIDGDPLADFVKAVCPWAGTARELLAQLNEKTPDAVRNTREWFRQPRHVANALRRLAPALRQVGINVAFARTNGTRLIHVTHVERGGIPSSPSSSSSRHPENQGVNRDDGPGASLRSSLDSPNKTGFCDDSDAGDAAFPVCSDPLQRERVQP